MKELLDIKSRKKVAILEAIFNCENHSCSQEILLRELDMTYPTLRSLIDTINSDVKRFGFDKFSIIHSPSNQLYTINIHEESSIQFIIHAYVKDSPKFKLLELLLTSSFSNLQLVADKLFLPYVSLRKDIKELNELLKPHCISISTRKGIKLEGDEIGIRLYYTFLFLTVYGGESWPFAFIQYHEITELLKNCPKEIYNAGYLDKGMLVHFYLAIHLIRVRKNHPIQRSHTFSVPLYSAYSDESKKSFNLFIASLGTYLPNINEEKLIYTARILLSVIVAFGSYSSIETIPTFFNSEPLFKQNNFLKTLFSVCTTIDQHLSIPLSKTEKEKLMYSLMGLHYRYLLFTGLSLNLESMILGYTKIERNSRKSHKVKHLRELVNKLMELEEFSIFEPYKKELSSDYFLILEKRIDFSIHTLPIKVVILSITSNETGILDFMNNFSNFYNVCVTDVLDEDIDLVISDFPLSNHVLTTFSIRQPIVYVNTRWSESDYIKINKKLGEIATSKFINKVDEI